MVRSRKSLSLIAAACLLPGFLAAAPAAAESCAAPQLEGTWVVEVTLTAPPPGFPPSFTALETYSRGCGMVTSNNLPPVSRPGHGEWAQESGRRFDVAIQFFTFDAAGNPAGSIVVTHAIRITGRGRYAGLGAAEFLDAAGNSLGAAAFTSEGVRLWQTLGGP